MSKIGKKITILTFKKTAEKAVCVVYTNVNNKCLDYLKKYLSSITNQKITV